jgi:hypothetical protein
LLSPEPGRGSRCSRSGNLSNSSRTQAGATRLAAILAEHTATPDQCTFLIGAYWAGFFPERLSMPVIELGNGTGKMQYHVSGGNCDRSYAFSVVPDWWWPADRSWIVTTPTDGQSTLVGCDPQTAKDLQADPAIEAWPVNRSDLSPQL